MPFKHPKIYFPDLPRKGEIIITDDNYYHLARSVRARPGDSFKLFNGDGFFASAKIDTIDRTEVRAQITEAFELDNTPKVKVTLAFGILPPNPLSILLAGTSQLGVVAYRPFRSEFNDMKIPGNRMEKLVKRWESIIIENCAVSGRSHLPTISSFHELIECVSDFENFDYRFAFWEDGGKPLSGFLPVKHGRVLVVIGPKGGLHQSEIDFLRVRDFEICTLGDLILKAEIASISACARIIGDN
jgi:16S rRNA (uracil1498-N3)-methyltransferase